MGWNELGRLIGLSALPGLICTHPRHIETLNMRVTFWILLSLATAPSFAATYNLTIPPREGEAYQTAHYRLWLPDDIGVVRGIIVRQHGCGPGARKLGLENSAHLLI